MKTLISFCLLIAVLITSCCREEECETRATIKGYDLRLCACCGGTLILLSDGTIYQAYDIPESLSNLPESEFPFEACIDYEILDQPCKASDGIIHLKSYQKIK